MSLCIDSMNWLELGSDGAWEYLYMLTRMELGYWDGRTRIELLGFMVGTNLRIVCQRKLGQ